MAPPHFPQSDRRGAPVRDAAPADEHDDMQLVALPPISAADSTVRCECTRCGAHVEARRSWRIAGWCQNCGCYDLRPLHAAPRLDPAPTGGVAFRVARVA